MDPRFSYHTQTAESFSDKCAHPRDQHNQQTRVERRAGSYECVRDYDPGRILASGREGASHYINQGKDKKLDQGLQGSDGSLCRNISPTSHMDIHLPVLVHSCSCVPLSPQKKQELKRKATNFLQGDEIQIDEASLKGSMECCCLLGTDRRASGHRWL